MPWSQTPALIGSSFQPSLALQYRADPAPCSQHADSPYQVWILNLPQYHIWLRFRIDSDKLIIAASSAP